MSITYHLFLILLLHQEQDGPGEQLSKGYPFVNVKPNADYEVE